MVKGDETGVVDSVQERMPHVHRDVSSSWFTAEHGCSACIYANTLGLIDFSLDPVSTTATKVHPPKP